MIIFYFVNFSDDSTSSGPPYRTYPLRWWVLLSFSSLAAWQGAVWNTFGPVDAALRYAYGWSDATVAIMPDWGTVAFLVSVAPLTWLLRRCGLRAAVMAAAFAAMVGSAAHTLTTAPAAFTVLAHVGAIINGVAGVAVLSVPPALSAAWFPPSERTTATSISQV